MAEEQSVQEKKKNAKNNNIDDDDDDDEVAKSHLINWKGRENHVDNKNRLYFNRIMTS